MNEKFKSMLLECYSPYAVEQIDYEKFAKIILQECIGILENDRNYNKCVYTTWDQSQAKCVSAELVKNICDHFQIEIKTGVKGERTVG